MSEQSPAAAGEGGEIIELQHLEVGFEEGIARVVIQRPKALNALNTEVLVELDLVLDELAVDETVRVIVLSGGGDKAFVAGADIAEMAEMEPLEARAFSRMGQAVLDQIEGCPKPVIAMIQGYALGGGLELALACHLRVASTAAKLGLPEVGLGLIPGFGGTQRLMRLAGAGVAREWVLTAEHFPAEEAWRVGIVNRLFAPEELEEGTLALARRIASQGGAAQALALEVMRRGLETGQGEGENTESDAFGLVFATKDRHEGIRAFLEKRKPSFQGR